MHASLCAKVILCVKKGQAGSPDSKDTLISLIHSNLAEIRAHACKHIACMHASLCAWFVLCTQVGLVWSPNFMDTTIFLIQSDVAEICTKQ